MSPTQRLQMRENHHLLREDNAKLRSENFRLRVMLTFADIKNLVPLAGCLKWKR